RPGRRGASRARRDQRRVVATVHLPGEPQPPPVPGPERAGGGSRPRAATLPTAPAGRRPLAGPPPTGRARTATQAGARLDLPGRRRVVAVGGRRRAVAAVKAALYNSHLRTLGGGEQHALAIARWLLGRGHDVDLLARPGVTIGECEARLGVSLTGARVVEIDDDPIAAEKEATARSASYELFVNATYASGAPSEAERSAVLVYFPV